MSGENPCWLMMLYLSGDNNLSFEMVRAINELGALGAPNDIAITIQFDPVAPGASPLVYRLNPGEKAPQEAGAPIPSAAALVRVPAHELPPSKSGVSEDAASKETLARFIQWSVEQFPGAPYRMLILSGHGSGAIGDFLTDQDSGRGRTSSLTISKLGSALQLAADSVPASQQTGGKLIQILGMDSCLMSMGEVAVEVAPHVDFLVGSEGFVPEAGWPYGFLLKELRKRIRDKRAVGPQAVSTYLVTDFLTFYRTYLPAGVSVDMAACDLRDSNLKELTDATRNLVNQIKFKGGQFADQAVGNAVILAHWRSQSFKFEQYTDIWDFCHELREELRLRPIPETSAIVSACEEVQRAINVLVGRAEDQLGDENGENPVVDGRQGAEGVDFQYARGLSIYFPWSLPVDRAPLIVNGNDGHRPAHFLALTPYGKLKFCTASGWDEFLADYLNATMRKPRAGNYLPVDSAHSPSHTNGYPPEYRKWKYAPDYGRFAPDYGRFAPDYGRFAPDYGRFAPDYGRFLALAFGNVPPGSMKNGPQRVEAPVSGQGTVVTPPAKSAAARKKESAADHKEESVVGRK